MTIDDEQRVLRDNSIGKRWGMDAIGISGDGTPDAVVGSDNCSAHSLRLARP